MAVYINRRFDITAFFRVFKMRFIFLWQSKHPEGGSNAETSVDLYRHLSVFLRIFLTFICSFKTLRSFLNTS